MMSNRLIRPLVVAGAAVVVVTVWSYSRRPVAVTTVTVAPATAPDPTTTIPPPPATIPTTTTTTTAVSAPTTDTTTEPSTTTTTEAQGPVQGTTTTTTVDESLHRYGSGVEAARGFRDLRTGFCTVADVNGHHDFLTLDASCMDPQTHQVPSSQWPTTTIPVDQTTASSDDLFSTPTNTGGQQ